MAEFPIIDLTPPGPTLGELLQEILQRLDGIDEALDELFALKGIKHGRDMGGPV